MSAIHALPFAAATPPVGGGRPTAEKRPQPPKSPPVRARVDRALQSSNQGVRFMGRNGFMAGMGRLSALVVAVR